MGQSPYSTDLRARVVQTVSEGVSRRAAGRLFKVSVSSAIRWVDLEEKTGSVAPKPRRHRRSPCILHDRGGGSPFLGLTQKIVAIAVPAADRDEKVAALYLATVVGDSGRLDRKRSIDPGKQAALIEHGFDHTPLELHPGGTRS